MTSDDAGSSPLVLDRELHVTDEQGTPIASADCVRVAANGTFLDGRTGEDGVWAFSDPYKGTVTALVAANGRVGAVRSVTRSEWSGRLELEMPGQPRGGSRIFRTGSGELPGLVGRLNPIRDTLGRTYMYGDNLSFQDSPEQPFSFSENQPFTVEDAFGTVFEVTVRAILGRTSLLDYRSLRESPLPPPVTDSE
jgi:hypothetical protein